MGLARVKYLLSRVLCQRVFNPRNNQGKISENGDMDENVWRADHSRVHAMFFISIAFGSGKHGSVVSSNI